MKGNLNLALNAHSFSVSFDAMQPHHCNQFNEFILKLLDILL